MKKILLLVLCLSFAVQKAPSLFALNIYDFFNKQEELIQNGDLQKALSNLKIQLNSKRNKFKDKTLFLIAWVLYSQKNYQESSFYSKKLALNYPYSQYLYPCVILLSSAYIHLKNEKRALKLLNWVIKNPPLNKTHLYLAYFLKRKLKPSTKILANSFELSLLKLCFESPVAPSYNIEDDSNIFEDKNDTIVKKLSDQKKDLKNTKEISNIKSNQKISKKEFLKRWELRLKQKEKRLSILKILLDEKKRLLDLREQYLNSQKKQGDTP